jgi:hypothetical protein
MIIKYIVLIFALICLGLFLRIKSNFFLLMTLGLAAYSAYLFFKPDKKKAGPADTHANATPESKPKPEPKPQDVPMEAVLTNNLRIRKARLSQSVLAAYEGLFDQIIRVWPRIYQQSPEGELSWVVARIATDYLPNKSITPYLNLPVEKRSEAEQSVIDSLTGMSKELTDIEKMLDDQLTGEFDRKAKFLKQRFL